MIGKSLKRPSAIRVVDYLAGKGHHNEHVEQRVIAADVETVLLVDPSGDLTRKDVRIQLGHALRDPARQWGREKQQNVWHIPISLPTGERIDDEAWRKVAAKLTTTLGVDGHRWAMVRHGDSREGNDHAHLVIQRTHSENGRLLSISHDYPKITRAVARISREMGLTELAEQQPFLPVAERRSDLEPRPKARYQRLKAAVSAAVKDAQPGEYFDIALARHGVRAYETTHQHARDYGNGRIVTELRAGIVFAETDRPDVWIGGAEIDYPSGKLWPIPDPLPQLAPIYERDSQEVAQDLDRKVVRSGRDTSLAAAGDASRQQSPPPPSPQELTNEQFDELLAAHPEMAAEIEAYRALQEAQRLTRISNPTTIEDARAAGSAEDSLAVARPYNPPAPGRDTGLGR